MKFTSFVPLAFKINLISCLIIRAFKICSSSFSFNLELSFLKEHFLKNSFPPKLLDNTFKKVLHNVYNLGVPFHSAAKKQIYFSFQYLGFQSNCIKRQISALNKFYPQLNINVISTNHHTIGSYFKFQGVIPNSLASSVIYKYTCRQCSAAYIGETRKQVKVRICQHKGISPRTGRRTHDPPNSKIYSHSFEENHPIYEDDFKIIARCPEKQLRILESIFIHDFNSCLNDQQSSYDLNILG